MTGNVMTAPTLTANPFADFAPAPVADLAPPPFLRAVVAFDGGDPYPVHDEAKALPAWMLVEGDYTFSFAAGRGAWSRLAKAPESGFSPDLLMLTTASGARTFVGAAAQVVVRHAYEVILSLRVVRCSGAGCFRERLLEPGDYWTCPDCGAAR